MKTTTMMVTVPSRCRVCVCKRAKKQLFSLHTAGSIAQELQRLHAVVYTMLHECLLEMTFFVNIFKKYFVNCKKASLTCSFLSLSQTTKVENVSRWIRMNINVPHAWFWEREGQKCKVEREEIISKMMLHSELKLKQSRSKKFEEKAEENEKRK